MMYSSGSSSVASQLDAHTTNALTVLATAHTVISSERSSLTLHMCHSCQSAPTRQPKLSEAGDIIIGSSNGSKSLESPRRINTNIILSNMGLPIP